MLKKKIYIIPGLSILAVVFLVGILVPYQTTVMEFYDEGKTFDIIARLDNYLIGSSKFFLRRKGIWISGMAPTTKVFIKRPCRDVDGFH